MFLISVPQREHAGEALQLHRKRARRAVLLHDPARRRRHPRFAVLVLVRLKVLQVAAQQRGRHLAPGALLLAVLAGVAQGAVGRGLVAAERTRALGRVHGRLNLLGRGRPTDAEIGPVLVLRPRFFPVPGAAGAARLVLHAR